MDSISEGRQYLRLRESKIGRQNVALLQPDEEDQKGAPLGLGAAVGGREGFTSFLGPTAVNPVNRQEADEVRKLEDDFNGSLSKFASAQAHLMDDTKRFVETTAPGKNVYARKLVKFRNGWVGYVSRYGEVRLLPGQPYAVDTASPYQANMEQRPGCKGETVSIPADFPAAGANQLPPRGVPIKVDGMSAPLFYGGELPAGGFGIPCGMEGTNVHATMMADAPAMWQATDKGKKSGADTPAAGLYARPADRRPSTGGGAFVGCVRAGRSAVGAGRNLLKQDDLGTVDRFACFTRAVDLGASAYGLADAKEVGDHAEGTCYVSYDDQPNVIADVKRSGAPGCLPDKSSYRHATTLHRATIEETAAVISKEEATQGIRYGLTPWGRLAGVRGDALDIATQAVASAKAGYWRKKWAIDGEINQKEAGAYAGLAKEQASLESRANALSAAQDARTSAVAAANAAITAVSQAKTDAEAKDLLARAKTARDAALAAGKQVTQSMADLSNEEQKLAKVTATVTTTDSGLEQQRRSEHEKNNTDLRGKMEKIHGDLYKNVILQVPAEGETPAEKCARTSAYVGSCYGDAALVLADDGTVQLVRAADYHASSGGDIQGASWSWSSGDIMGLKLPSVAACATYRGALDASLGGSPPVLGPGDTLSSPLGACRLVMRVAPMQVPGTETRPPQRDASGTWQPASKVAVSVDDPSGRQRMFLELQWFASECAGLHDTDDLPDADPMDQGQAGGLTSSSVALHQVPGLPDSPWRSEGATAQKAYYVLGSVSGACPETLLSAPTKRPYDSAAAPSLGATYSRISGYDSNGHDIPGAHTSNASLDQCKTRCNGDPGCGGFAYRKEGGGCFPKEPTMFPKGLRHAASGTDLYVRHVKPEFAKDSVCPVGTQSSTVYQLQSFGTGTPVAPDMPCDLAAAAGCDRRPVEEAAEALGQKRGAMLRKIQELGKTDSRLVAELGYNVDRLKNDIAAYSDTVGRSGELAAGGLVGPSAHQEDTDLLMVQENYRYLLWTLGAVVAVGLGLKMSRN